MKKARQFDLKIRQPRWTENMTASVNGSPVSSKTEGGYMVVNRKWQDGDVISIEIPMHLTAETTPDKKAQYSFLYGPIVLAAKENHTLLEINSCSLMPARHKVHARANNLELLRLCKDYQVPVILASDAHINYDIANYEHVLPLLEETHFPESLIMNDKPDWFFDYLQIPRFV